MARLVYLALTIFSVLPTGLAGPACAKKAKSASDCMTRCALKWGFPGHMMGQNAWGSVMDNSVSVDAWDDYIAKACGEDSAAQTASTTSTSSVQATGLVKALGTLPGAFTEASSTSTTSSSSSTSSSTSSTIRSTSSTRFTTSTRTSTTTSSTHTSTSTTSTQVKPTPAVQQQLKTTSTTHTTAKAAATQQSSSNGNSGSSNSNSGSSNSGSSNSGPSSNSGSSNTNTGSSSSNSGSSSSGGSGASASDQQRYLAAHNSVRAQHGASPVTWSDAAAAKAQEWADKCTNTHSGGTLGPLGENLAAGTGDFSIEDGTGLWAKEVSEYDPSNPQPSHFTQMVWKATTQIGCAQQTCDGLFAGFGSATYIVCEYSVQGNVLGEFAANVQA
ncbi:CAP domain-containing protein [Roridomyces roridus]|uniref:CAP domain-containing protein n=1 Tax=Roridomyces roridus TaxID=1738132 RepID=A0AAD7FNM1_9AGAR|nr:CAP domain-containing protein [Roridomyces roridus]